MIKWIDKPLALSIHDRQIAEHGGGTGIRDDALLEAALARPQQLHAHGEPAPDLAALAASLAAALAGNHPFVDGNKPTAHVSYRAFIALNGAELVASDEEKYVAMLSLAEASVDEAGFAAWLRKRIVTRSTGRVQERRSTAPRRRTGKGR